VILDKANETIRIFDTLWVDDGYGGRNPVPASTFKAFKAFVLPTSFAGAGWAVNIRYAAQGWADTARITAILKWRPELAHVKQWTQVEAQGQIWTVVQAPKRFTTRRLSFVSILLELKGEVGDAP
jgi:hypothetical protein